MPVLIILYNHLRHIVSPYIIIFPCLFAVLHAKVVEKNRTVPIENPLNDAEPTSGTVPYDEDDPITILFIRSDLRLVVDLQDCVKAQQSRAYAQKIKISNLQQMAKTIAYVQEHEYGTREDLQESFEEVKSHMRT